MILWVALWVVGVSASCTNVVSCTNPGTGTATECCVVSNIKANGPGGDRYLCPSRDYTQPPDSSGSPIDCFCPLDTCVPDFEQDPYQHSGYLANFPQCQTINGVGYYYRAINIQSNNEYFYCANPIRQVYGQTTFFGLTSHGDLATGFNGGLPFYPFQIIGNIAAITCDCGWISVDANHICTARTSTTSCKNPLTSAFVNFQVVSTQYASNGQCLDNNGVGVPCYCPADTCNVFSQSGNSYPECRVINGVGTIGFGYNTQLANNHAYMFCTSYYRTAICNGNGDIATGTQFILPSTASNPVCTCDCGFFDSTQSGVTRRCAASGFILTPTCINPATGRSATFQGSTNPQTGASSCSNPQTGAQVKCWCPSDTCTVSFSTNLAVCSYGWTGYGWNTTTANAHEYLQCCESYRSVICNNHGVQPTSFTANSPLLSTSNPPGPCTCDTQWWDTTYPSGQVIRCNFQSNCSISTRMGFQRIPCSGHGTCQRNSSCICQSGWGGPACDQNLLCPSASPNLECSGFGTCLPYLTPFDVMTYGVWSSLFNLHINPLIPNNFTTSNAPAFQVCQAGLNLLFMATQQTLQNTIAVNCSNAITAMSSACVAGQIIGGPMACFRSMLAYLFTGTLGLSWRDFLSSSGYKSNLPLYVQNAFAAYYPLLVPIDSSWILPVAKLLNSTNTQTQAEGLARLLIYTNYANFLNPNLGYASPYPSFPQYVCRCNAGTQPSQLSPSGNDCSRFCPYNPEYFGFACGGVSMSVTAGQCNTATSQCVCNPAYETVVDSDNPINACNFDMVGFCIPETGGPVCSTPQFQAEAQGQCSASLIAGTYGPTPVGECVCASNWKGDFCSISTCTNTTVECGNNGACNGANSHCSCNAIVNGVNQKITNPPPLWVGANCSHNAITACGHFIPIAGGQGTGTWTQCNNVGVCQQNTTAHGKPYNCYCVGDNFGAQCQFTGCNPACNSSNSICNLATGTCSCQTMWAGPMCNQNLCMNGHPNSNGTTCVCNQYWTVTTSGANAGKCATAQCPFVANTVYSGVRACNYTTGDKNCVGSSSGTIGCCFDNCGSECSVSGGVPTCTCLPPAFFNEASGICFPVCNGGTAHLIGGTVTCSCAQVTQYIDTSVQYVDGFCKVFTCANGGTAHSGGCTCPATWTGSTCTTNACQHGGTPGPNAMCVCANGYGGNVCQTQVNPPVTSSSSTGSPFQSSSSSTASTHSSSSSTGSTHSSSSSTGSTHSSSSSTASKSSSSSTASAEESSSPVLSTGAITGIAVAGGAVVVTGVTLLIVYAVKPSLLLASKTTGALLSKTSV